MTMTELKAGRELDALVAEKVMGDRRGKFGTSADGSRQFSWKFTDGEISENPRHYSTDIAAAWLVVEKLIARGDEFTLERISLDKVWRAKVYPFTKDKGWAGGGYFTSSNDVAVNAKTAPLAICRAALLAVGAQ